MSDSIELNADAVRKEPIAAKPALQWGVFLLSGGLLVAFVVAALVDLKRVEAVVASAFGFSTDYFGAFWQFLVLANFLVAIGLVITPYGSVRLGGDRPEMSTFRWIAILMCTLLAAGGVFYSFAEPISHFVNVPPLFEGVGRGTNDAVGPALAQSFHHWGFLPWAICGTLGSVVVMYAHYHRGMPLRPRTLLFPFASERVINSYLGTLVDTVCIIAIAAGTIGPIGFLGLQLSYTLSKLTDIPHVYGTQLTIIGVLVAVYTISAVSGIQKGIQILSRSNVILCLVLFALILIIGPSGFVFKSYLRGFGGYLRNFIPLSVNRTNTEWLNSQTVFFWAWFLGCGPITAIFVARISRGRTIREIVLAIAIIAPIATTIWFASLGGSSLYYELQRPGSISIPLAEGGLPSALLATVQQLPMPWLLTPAFLVLIVIFLATTGDSIAYTISIVITGEDTPPRWIRVFWAVTMGAVAAILLLIGDAKGIRPLQNAIVITAVPVSLILLPVLVGAPRVAVMAFKERIDR